MGKKQSGCISTVLLFVCLIVGMLVLIINPLFEWVSYNLYYKFMYTYFSGSLYFPFYLYFIRFLFLSICALILVPLILYSLNPFSQDNKKEKTLSRVGYGFGIIVIFGLALFLFVQNTKECIGDWNLVRQNKVEVAEYHKYKVYRRLSRKKSSISYRLACEEKDCKHPVLHLNIYQYRRLMNSNEFSQYSSIPKGETKKFSLPDSLIARVRYLPNTNLILSYEILAQ
ncbi:hypothetical protein [Dysgonomonas macrotermitis]|uniref:Uncharacterized protein n=1 Tax=Dysgonomonas macrotermitis TaxID=1346286 RepID=A0A1M5H5C8_9BACT|nr:hypothetical protein [Dysgonomonas macrotermitis]SHG11108.1 hypothetical protein SAMN05444362_11591 [Dysgonomonas macrotermitis]